MICLRSGSLEDEEEDGKYVCDVSNVEMSDSIKPRVLINDFTTLILRSKMSTWMYCMIVSVVQTVLYIFYNILFNTYLFMWMFFKWKACFSVGSKKVCIKNNLSLDSSLIHHSHNVSDGKVQITALKITGMKKAFQVEKKVSINC